MLSMNHRGLEQAVRERSRQGVIAALLDGGLARVADGAQAFNAVRHPLGFVCLPVSRELPDIGTCVHIWSAGDVPTRNTSAIHCHSWDLLSYVLSGTVVNQTYAVAQAAQGPYGMYEIRSVADEDHVIGLDRRVDARIAHRGVHESGDHYELPAGDFHTSSLLSDDAVTVVIGKLRPHGRDLSLGDPAMAPPAKRRVRFDHDETVALVRSLLASPAVSALVA